MIKFFFKILILFLFISCHNGNYSVTHIVKTIEQGKDGYNAVIVDNNGKEYDATISRNDMGVRYRKLTIGDKVKIYGDSSQYGDRIDIHVTKIAQ